MPNLSMQAFAAANFAGQQLNQELLNRKQDSEIKQQQVAEYQQNFQARQQQQLQSQQQQAAMAKIISEYDQENSVKQVQSGIAPDTQAEQQANREAKLYGDLGRSLLRTDPAKAQGYLQLESLAAGRQAEVASKNQQIQERRAKDVAAVSGAALAALEPPDDGNPPPDIGQVQKQYFDWVQKNVSLADAQSIPTRPADFKAFLRSKQEAGLTAAEQLRNKREQEDAAQKALDRKAALEERRQARLESQAALAANRETSLAIRQMAVQTRAQAVANEADNQHFRQTETLNRTLQAQAKPFLDDRERIQTVENLLKIDNSASDRQIQQDLVGISGSFKGKATNLYFKQNAHFGDMDDRLTSFVSKAFTGRYSAEDRKQIRDMLAGMRDKVIDPSLSKLESDQKRHAAGYKGLDVGQVGLQGEFNRTSQEAPTATPASPASARPSPYAEGTVATNPKTGASLIFKQGKWVPK